MAASTRQQILESVLARLRLIAVAAGFSTDAGAAVYLGEAPELGPDDPQAAIVIAVGDDVLRYQGEQLFIELPIELGALARADLAAPYLAAEAVLGDIKRAIELPDRTLGGLVKRQLERVVTRTLPREPGSTAVGIAITYSAPYTEVWGNPQMGQMVTVTLNTRELTGVFQRLGRRGPIALARALNRTGGSERTALARAVATDMGIKVGVAREAIAIENASATRLAVRVIAKGARIPLFDFKAKGPFPSRGRGRGVTYNLGAGGGRGRLDRGFIAQMASGHRGVFIRKNASTGKSRGAWSQNLPIQEKFGPSIAHVFAKQVPVGEARRTDVLLKNVQHELEFALSKT